METNEIIGICLMCFGSILIFISIWMYHQKSHNKWGYVDVIKKK